MTSVMRACSLPMLRRVLCLTAVAACGVATEPLIGQETAAMIDNSGDCSTYDCGLNGPMMDGVYFSELYKPPPPWFPLSWTTNDHGMRIFHYYTSDTAWYANAFSDNQLDVSFGKFTSPTEGAILELRRGTRTYLVKIEKIDHDQAYWTRLPGGPDPVASRSRLETYWLSYTKAETCHAIGSLLVCDPYVPLCHDKPDGEGEAMPAIVFEGDRYDQDSLAVDDSDTGLPSTWFNVACAGSLPSKMFLIRQTAASALDPTGPGGALAVPPLQVRQAFVDLWSAAYCGDGKSFTETGHPIRLRDLANSMRTDFHVGFDDGDYRSVEAVWGPRGALCLNQPRVGTHTFDEVRTRCDTLRPDLPLQRCPDDVASTWTTMTGAVAISVNPRLGLSSK